MTNFRTMLVFTLCLLAATALAQAAEPITTVDLRPLWSKGQTARYRITQTEVTVTEIPTINQSVEATTQIEAELTWQVTDADEAGGGKAKMSIDSLDLTITDGQGNAMRVSNRGGDPGTESYQTWAKALTSGAITVTVDGSGHVTDVSGYQAIQSRAGDAGAGLDGDYFREIAMDLAVLVGGQAQAKPGTTWKIQHGSKHRLGRIEYDSTYQLQGVEQIAGIPVAMVSRNSKMTFTPDLGNRPAEAPKVTVKTNEATHSAQILYDVSRHEVVGGHFEQVLGITMTISIQGRQIVQTNREVTSTQLLRIEEK